MKFKRKALCALGLLAVLAVFAWPALSVYYDGYHTNALIKGYFKVVNTDYVDAPATRSFDLPIGSFIVNGTPIAADGTTAPGIAATDNIPAAVWADNEVVPASISFRVPADYSTGMAFRVLASTSDDATLPEIDWQLWVNTDAVAFDAAAIAQDAVTLAASSATNEEVTLTPNAAGAAAIVAGSWITLDIWNTTTGSGTLEVKGLDAYYTSAR